MNVFGEIGEMRKIRKAANDVERRGDGHIVQQRGEFVTHGPGLGGIGAAKADRGLPHLFNARAAFFPCLCAQHLAEQATEKPRVLLERQVTVEGVVGHVRALAKVNRSTRA